MTFEQELDIYLRARFTLMVLVTPEEERALQTVKSVCERTSRPCLTWDVAVGGHKNATRVLAEALTKQVAPTVKQIVTDALRQVSNQNAINAACAVWQETRHGDLTALLRKCRWLATRPATLHLLTALKTGRRVVMAAEGEKIVEPLLQACEDVDAEIAAEAMALLGELRNQEAIDALCVKWAGSRSKRLAEALCRGRYVTIQPVEVRGLTALKTGQRAAIVGEVAKMIELLLQACADADAKIASESAALLRELTNPEWREAVCDAFTRADYPAARKVVVAAGYAPREAGKRALFYFLTDQIERYELLDFDQSLLRTVYESANTALRQRIREKIRAAGRTDFMTILVGGDYRPRAVVMTSSETEFLVQMLVANKEWARLWGLVFELPFVWSVRIVQTLACSGWRPENSDEGTTFEELVSAASSEIVMSDEEVSRFLPPEMVMSDEEVNRFLPPAVQRAQARVSGRVNDVAFSPVCPIIAIGTGQGKVGLWNFQRAKLEGVLDTFGHSVGRVTFTNDGVLLCAERTNSDAVCAVHGWHDGRQFRLGQHRGSVTVVEPVGGSQALTAGRDHKVIV